MSVRALGIALKLTFSGVNQLVYLQTWVFAVIVAACVVTQINYLNKVTFLSLNFFGQCDCMIIIFVSLFFFQALDTFNTAVVSPIYYVMFTSLTILASVIMFKV